MNKNERKAYRALQVVARKEGIPAEQVIQAIDDAIQEAYLTAQKENNQKVLESWNQIPCKGKLPTALEMVVYLAEKTNYI